MTNKPLSLYTTVIFSLLCLGSTFNVNAETAIKSPEQKFSYAIGFQIGQNLKQQGMNNIDPAALSQAVSDVLSSAKLKLSMEEMQTVVRGQQEKLQAARNSKGEAAKIAGEKFLTENKSKKGVKILDSGIQYKITKEGKGKKPTAQNSVIAHYHGTLINGKVFDSSYKRGKPATFPLNGVIKGWQEILPMMPQGSKWKVFIPSELAYGTRGAGGDIGPNETLIFDIELLEIK